MKAIITIEQFDNGISLKWRYNDTNAPVTDSQNIVALERDKEKAIGETIWEDVKNTMDVTLTNMVRLKIEYEPIKEERHD